MDFLPIMGAIFAASGAVSLIFASLAVMPLLFLGRVLTAHALCRIATSVPLIGGAALFVLSQIERYPVGSAQLFLAALWIAPLALGPAFYAWILGRRIGAP